MNALCEANVIENKAQGIEMVSKLSRDSLFCTYKQSIIGMLKVLRQTVGTF